MENELILTEKSKNGDVEAFSLLISAYEKKILNFTYRILSSKEDAEDVTQEVFVKAYRAIASFDNKSSFQTWIYKIAQNAALDFLRKQKRRGGKKNVSLYAEDEDGEYEIPIADKKNEPYSELRKKEAQNALEKAMEELGADQKEVIVLRDIQGFGYDEIAEITGENLGTVKSRISRARLLLRKKLEKNKELFIE